MGPQFTIADRNGPYQVDGNHKILPNKWCHWNR